MEIEQSEEVSYTFHCHLCQFSTFSYVEFMGHRQSGCLNVESNYKSDTGDVCSRNIDWYECAQCSYTTPFRVRLLSHKLNCDVTKDMEQINTTKTYKCEHCVFSSDMKRLLKVHTLEAHGLDKWLKRYACSYCPQSFSTQGKLKRHEIVKHKVTHPDVPWLDCDQCHFRTVYSNRLKMHINTMHTSEWNECAQCNFRTRWKNALSTHMIRMHMPKEQLELLDCPFCRYQAKIKAALNEHIKIVHDHDKHKKFQCSKCPYKCRKMSLLMRHYRSKHLNDDQVDWLDCPHCGYKAKFKSNLRSHIKFKHTNSNDVTWYDCQLCSYRAKAKSSIDRHCRVKHPNGEVAHQKTTTLPEEGSDERPQFEVVYI